MTDRHEKLRDTLRQYGLSLTAARRQVLAALQDQEPLTMNELVHCCPDIDRASVYRIVSVFEQLGIIQRLQIGWKYKLELSDKFAHHHHHFTCLKCGKIVTLPEDLVIEQQLAALAQSAHFVAYDHQLEIRGLCAACNRAPDKTYSKT